MFFVKVVLRENLPNGDISTRHNNKALSKQCPVTSFFYSFSRYEECKRSTFDFSTELDLLPFLDSPGQVEAARLLLDSVAHVLHGTHKPALTENFFAIGGDSINMVQVR
jgi:hypothetical protein